MVAKLSGNDAGAPPAAAAKLHFTWRWLSLVLRPQRVLLVQSGVV
jgi:hypothetical protein